MLNDQKSITFLFVFGYLAPHLYLDMTFQNEPTSSYNSVRDGLKAMYSGSLEPLEAAYNFHEFHSPRLSNADFDYKPSVMLIGQYSTGKVGLRLFTYG